MASTFTAGLLQLNSSGNVKENIATTTRLISEAADKGADFVLTPEMTNLLEIRSKPLFSKTVPEKEDPALSAFREAALKHSVWLLAGSLAIRKSEDKLANRSFLIDPQGKIAARYDKIHMFDVRVKSGEEYRESKNFEAGNKIVTAKLPWGTLGMSVCYDLRFPYLYRAMAQKGAEILAVPSAFTRVTGKAHWHVLLRARAIENTCYVLAPAQSGKHSDGRETFGHALAVDPWGKILLDGGDGLNQAFTVRVDLDKVKKVRERIPSLKHDRKLRPET